MAVVFSINTGAGGVRVSTCAGFLDSCGLPEAVSIQSCSRSGYGHGAMAPKGFMFNSTDSNCTSDQNSISRLHEFQIIKAVVLASVTVIILLSVCKMVFQLFVRYTVKSEKS